MPKQKVVCPTCKERFKNSTGLSLHVRQAHTKNDLRAESKSEVSSGLGEGTERARPSCAPVAVDDHVTGVTNVDVLFRIPEVPLGKQRCVNCGNKYVRLERHVKCSMKLLKRSREALDCQSEHIEEELSDTSERATSDSLDSISEDSDISFCVTEPPDNERDMSQQQCFHLADNAECEYSSDIQLSDDTESGSSVTGSNVTDRHSRSRRRSRRHCIGTRRKSRRKVQLQTPILMPQTSSEESLSQERNSDPKGDVEKTERARPCCAPVTVEDDLGSGSNAPNETSHARRSERIASQNVSAPNTSHSEVYTPECNRPKKWDLKQHMERMLRDFNKKHLPRQSICQVDPLYDKLKAYHDRLAAQVPNIVTEKITPEVRKVIADIEKVDEVCTSFSWSPEDERRLNELNVEVKNLQPREDWYWGAAADTAQGKYNHARMQYLMEEELKPKIIHCSECKSTGILVGLDQVGSSVCYDCLLLSKASKKDRDARTAAWDKVRPDSDELPKIVDRPDTELPDLTPGDKAVIAPVHPAVTITKNYLGTKKLRQESVSLLQEPEPTWTQLLPRENLNKRFVVIERMRKDNTLAHITANPERVRQWLTYLFIHHKGFVDMKGHLTFSQEIMDALDPEAELAEVCADPDELSENSKSGDKEATATSSTYRRLPEEATGRSRPLCATVPAESGDIETSTSSSADRRQANEASGRARPLSAPAPAKSVENEADDGIVQAAMESGLSKTEVFSFDKLPRLYLTAKEFLRLKQGGQMELIKDRTIRVPIYDASANMAFPHLYPHGEPSPLDFGRYTLSRYLLKKQTMFAHKTRDGKYRWKYAEDDIHMMYQYARLVEEMVHANVGFYISEHPGAAHVPIECVLTAFREGLNEQGLLDSHMPDLSAILTQMPNSREQWFSERLGVEAISRDRGDANLFMTQSMEIRAWRDVRELLHLLEYGTAMPVDFPFEKDTNKFTELVNKHAAMLNIYLYRKCKLFTDAFLHDICRISRKQSGDYTEEDRVNDGWCWSRVEWTESRGVAHWHSLVKLPNVLDTALLGRIVQNGRMVRKQLKQGNINPDDQEEAWEIIEMGLVANRYVTMFADSISTASFRIDKRGQDGKLTKVDAPIEKYRSKFVTNYKNGNISTATHPLMRTYKDEDATADPVKELAEITAVSCMHHCMSASCGGDEKTGAGCRFDFPKRKLPCTICAVMEVSKTQMEARILVQRTCDRVPNLNPLFLRYWRANHDVTVLVDASHKMRYATKYAAKSGKSTELLNEMLDMLQKRASDVLPPTTKQVLSHLALADCSQRAFVSKQQLAYNVMDLPLVRKTFSDVGIVGFYRRANLTLSNESSDTIVYSDRTEYAAYAERCNDNTLPQEPLTKETLRAMCFREFAETVSRQWITDRAEAEEIPTNEESADRSRPACATVAADGAEGATERSRPSCATVPADAQTKMAQAAGKRKLLKRDAKSGHWKLRLMKRRRHIRWSTVLNTESAAEYEPVTFTVLNNEAGIHYEPVVECGKTFYDLPIDKRNQLYRSYMELVCYVPWTGSPEDTFITDAADKSMIQDDAKDSEKNCRYSLKRLEAFFKVYHSLTAEGKVAPRDSLWRRDNQYSLSMYLTSLHNKTVHEDRKSQKGVLKVQFEPDDELEGLDVDIRPALYDSVDDSDYPSVLTFLPPDTLRAVFEQPAPNIAEIAVAFPEQHNYKELEKLVMLDRSKLFMADPPAPTVNDEEMTAVQRWAVERGCDPEQQILFICGKAGSGKTAVALKICEKLRGSVQAGAGTGKAASIFRGPTMHSMFGWSFEEFQDGDAYVNNSRKIQTLKTFYEKTKCFVIDEVNQLSASTLGQLHDTLSAIFQPEKNPNRPETHLPFGGVKMIFLGDAAQLGPPVGAAIYDEGSSSNADVRGFRGKMQTILHRTVKGQELYRKHLMQNCIILKRGQRNTGLLAEIMDKIRNGEQDDEDLQKLTFQRRRFPQVVEDVGVHYTNEACYSHNCRQLWNQCQSKDPPTRVYICRASYHVTNTNQNIVDALASLSSKKFGFAADTLFLSLGCQIRLVRNISVAAGLVNSATATVVAIVYNNADKQPLLQGKHPPPYFLLVRMTSFRGFPVKGKPDERHFPCPDDHSLVPIYRIQFRPSFRDVPRWVLKTQELKNCFRTQFPVDLATHITAHRAQGQTLENCIVSVNLDFARSDKHLPADMGSILYVACTRATELRNLFVGRILPTVWEKIGKTEDDVDRRKMEVKLEESARKFAKRKGLLDVVDIELAWKPDYSRNKDEWLELQQQQAPPTLRQAPATGVSSMEVDDECHQESEGSRPACATLPAVIDLRASIGDIVFPMCMAAVLSERHIGLDPGRRNFGIVVVDQFVDQLPTVVNAANYDLQLPAGIKADRAVIALRKDTDLWTWMQQTDVLVPPVVERVVVHVEQMSNKNADWKQLGVELAKKLQEIVGDPSRSLCVIKLSQANVHRADGPMFHMGKEIVTALGLSAPSYKKTSTAASTKSKPTASTLKTEDTGPPPVKRRKPLVKQTSSDTSAPESAERDVESCSDDNMDDERCSPSIATAVAADTSGSPENERDVEPCIDDRMDDERSRPSSATAVAANTSGPVDEYRMKKTMSSEIFRYVVNADENQQQDMNITVHPDLQNSWRQKLSERPSTKLDDVGDALLHALNEILCGGSNYRQLLPATSSLHDNRTVVIAVLPDDTFWVVLHSSWNLFRLEAFGTYPSQLRGLTYKSKAAIDIIKDTLDPELKTALTDMRGTDAFAAVDHIKVVVKQLQEYISLRLSSLEAGALTNSTVTAMKQLCTESAGTNSKLCERNDERLGSVYIRVNVATQQKFQVIRSSGKHTNTVFSLLEWMKENVHEFVEYLRHRLSQSDKLSFFTALVKLASSDGTRLGMLELSPTVKQKLKDKLPIVADDDSKKLLADLTLIGVNTNQQHVKSIAANYRIQPVRYASTQQAQKHKQDKQTADEACNTSTADNNAATDSKCQPMSTPKCGNGQGRRAPPFESRSESLVAQTPLTTYDVASCGPARSHDGYLQNVAASNHLRVLRTVGNGDCFFSAVQIGLRQIGMERSIANLREAAAIELVTNRALYEPLYHVEDNVHQAPTYELFVQRTIETHEWATELTVSAMARSLDVVINVVSTANDENGQPTAHARLYDEGVVNTQNVIVVGYNANETHYVAFTK